jgi:Cu/Ag efflux protein CusF
MNKQIIKLIGIGMVTAFVFSGATIVHAQDKAEKEKSSNRAIPFRGNINEVDKSAKTINIGKEKKRTIHVTEKTKIIKDGKTATLDEAKAGDEVGGAYRESADGKLKATSLRIGPKPEAEEKKKKE